MTLGPVPLPTASPGSPQHQALCLSPQGSSEFLRIKCEQQSLEEGWLYWDKDGLEASQLQMMGAGRMQWVLCPIAT